MVNFAGKSSVVDVGDMYFQASVSESDFGGFSAIIPELIGREYDDFVMERDGYFIGLSAAGETIVQFDVPFRLFRRWLELTGMPCRLDTLDDLAMRRWLRREHPEWSVRLVPSADTSCQPHSGACLYVPIAVTKSEAYSDHETLVKANLVSGAGVARAVTRECLDTLHPMPWL